MLTTIIPTVYAPRLTYTTVYRKLDVTGGWVWYPPSTFTQQVDSNDNYWKLTYTRYSDKDRYMFAREHGYFPLYPYRREFREPPVVAQFWSQYYITAYKRWIEAWHCLGSPLGINGLPPTYGTDTDVTSKVDSVLNDAASRLNETVRNMKYSAFETLFEGKKTVKMVNSTVATVWQTMRAVKRGRFVQAARLLGLKSVPKGARKGQSLSDNWLAYRYGWMPLYYTVYGEMQRQFDIVKNHSSVGRVLAVRARSSRSHPRYRTRNTAIGALISPPGLQTYDTLRIENVDSLDIRAQYVVYYRLTNPSMANATMLGITNPLLVAWEIVPLSFVADWFVNVSDVLSQLDAWSGKTFLAGAKTYKVVSKAEQYLGMHYNSSDTQYQTHLTIKPGEHKRTVIERVLLTAPPSVSLELRTNLNLKRILDGVSLLRQMTK